MLRAPDDPSGGAVDGHGVAEGAPVAGRYRLDSEIGRGSVSVVWSAWDLCLHRRVAVKLYDAAAAGGISADEARLQGQCQHPDIMPLYDAGCDPALGVAYLVMPLFPGSDMRAELAQRGQMPIGKAISCVDQICGAVDWLWTSRRIPHGDIKPSNIWVTASGAAQLMDLNLAGLLARGRAVAGGTPGYAAPEALAGSADAASDAFSIGCVLYECLTGVPPYRTAAEALAGRPTRVRKLRPSVGRRLQAVVDRAIRPDPGRRYATARELRNDLRSRRRSGGSVAEALWGQAFAAAHFAWRVVGAAHRGAWRLARRLWRRPAETLIELCAALAGIAWLRNAAAAWADCHPAQVRLVGMGSVLALALVAAARVAAAARRTR